MIKFFYPKIQFRFLLQFCCILCCVVGCKQNRILTDRHPTNEQELRNEIQILAQAIASDNFIGTELMGRMQETSPAYSRRMELMQNATTDELLTLTGYPQPVVNLVAFEGLYDRGDALVPEIFKAFLERDVKINYIKGDISQQMPMAEYAYVYVLRHTLKDEPLPEELKNTTPKFELSRDEKKEAELTILALRQD